MADPLLTSLCSICHASAPKYKCPRCSIRTCSVPCIRKHKAWSECSGERDPTKYVPPAQLRTVAGINHDYNFLQGLGMSMERAERVLVRDRGIVREADLRPKAEAQSIYKTGRDGRKRRVMVPRESGQAKGRTFERLLAHRLRQLNVHIVCAPAGMARQKENNTTFNRRTGTINWQIEWLLFGEADEGQSATTRRLSKVLEDTPLYQAYREARAETPRASEADYQHRKAQRDGRRDEFQRSHTSSWTQQTDVIQEPATGRWIPLRGAHAGEHWPEEGEELLRREYEFFIAGPATGPGEARTVTPVAAGGRLRDVLCDTRVCEFPTVLVLRAGTPLPPGFVRGPKEPHCPPEDRKRRGGEHVGRGSFAKRARRDGDASEEGKADDGACEAHGRDAGEESWGEEGDGGGGGDDDDDESTSSSGTDGETD